MVVSPERNRQRVREWRADNPERHRKNVKDWQKAQPVGFYRDRSIQNRKKLKFDVITAYGGQCSCCGEDRLEFLTMDHINKDGKEDRGGANPSTFYRRLRREGYPGKDTKLRVLCFNCNCSIGLFGYCPHEKEREHDAEL